MTGAEWLDLVESKASALRQAGVSRVEITEDGCSVEFAPAYPTELQPVGPLLAGDPEDEEDPLDSRWTFGGGAVPGFSKLRERREDDDA